MTPIRPSIMNRRITATSLKNTQNEDKEFKDQLRVLYGKQERFAKKREHIQKTVSPKRDDVINSRQEMRNAMEDQLNQKCRTNKLLQKEEQNKAHYEVYYNKYCGPHNLEATHNQIYKKKEYLKQLMEENRQSECKKKEQAQREKQDEIEAEHIRAMTPCCWNQRHYI
ncbi:uncharacterized protein [Physcomitrium patens]|uniref:Uncharacterized protein n=1 Tax=Physcomitrium patens TaxID=3218 RepID=A0A2K1J2G9_PHYPA|nr:hypothetical protein PHYPA_021567 [Physcomitrium patens]